VQAHDGKPSLIANWALILTPLGFDAYGSNPKIKRWKLPIPCAQSTGRSPLLCFALLHLNTERFKQSDCGLCGGSVMHV